MADPPVLAVECTGLEYSFGTAMIVDSVDLRVRPGEMFELPGPNGAGKTPTIRVITTLLPVPPAMVSVCGQDPAVHKMQVRRLLGLVPHQLSADPGLTVRENVALFALVCDIPRRECKRRASAGRNPHCSS